MSFDTSLYWEPPAGHPSTGTTRGLENCSLPSLLPKCHHPWIWIACQRHWTHPLLDHCSSCITTVASWLRDIDRFDGSHTFVGEAKSASNLAVRSTCAGHICWTSPSSTSAIFGHDSLLLPFLECLHISKTTTEHAGHTLVDSTFSLIFVWTANHAYFSLLFWGSQYIMT